MHFTSLIVITSITVASTVAALPPEAVPSRDSSGTGVESFLALMQQLLPTNGEGVEQLTEEDQESDQAESTQDQEPIGLTRSPLVISPSPNEYPAAVSVPPLADTSGSSPVDRLCLPSPVAAEARVQSGVLEGNHAETPARGAKNTTGSFSLAEFLGSTSVPRRRPGVSHAIAQSPEATLPSPPLTQLAPVAPVVQASSEPAQRVAATGTRDAVRPESALPAMMPGMPGAQVELLGGVTRESSDVVFMVRAEVNSQSAPPTLPSVTPTLQAPVASPQFPTNSEPTARIFADVSRPPTAIGTAQPSMQPDHRGEEQSSDPNNAQAGLEKAEIAARPSNHGHAEFVTELGSSLAPRGTSTVAPSEPPRPETATDLRSVPQADRRTGAADPAREIALRVSGHGEPRVEMRVIERGGEVRVSVRTPDEALSRGMQERLSDLSGKLGQAGYQAETWQPARSQPSAFSDRRDNPEGDPSGGQQRQGSGDGSERRQKQDGDPERRPAWVEEELDKRPAKRPPTRNEPWPYRP